MSNKTGKAAVNKAKVKAVSRLPYEEVKRYIVRDIDGVHEFNTPEEALEFKATASVLRELNAVFSNLDDGDDRDGLSTTVGTMNLSTLYLDDRDNLVLGARDIPKFLVANRKLLVKLLSVSA